MSQSTTETGATSAGGEDLLVPRLVALDADLGATSEDVVRRLSALVGDAGRTAGPGGADGLAEAALAREASSPTGLPDGIAIPHARTASVSQASLAFARLSRPVDFGAPDGPADLVFLIAAPEGAGSAHLKLLSKLARALVKPAFRSSLRDARTAEDVVALVDGVLAPAPTTPSATTAAGAAAGAAAPAGVSGAVAADAAATVDQQKPAATATGARRIVAVTACPTGIAHTYMAADSLVAAGERAGVEVVVETQGSSGSTPLPADVIAGASAVIFAVDVGVKERGRFAGKPLVQSGVKRAINEPDVMVAEALRAVDDPSAQRVPGDGGAGAGAAAVAGGAKPGFGAELRRWLLTGVSYMIPFVAAGGLLLALGFLFGGYQIVSAAPGDPDGTALNTLILAQNSLTNLPDGGLAQYIGAVLSSLGQLAFGLLVPALAGYIAYAMADRPGIAPGFVAGLVAGATGAGFIGGLVGGLLAGAVALAISKISVPQWGRGLMPVVIIPLFATLITGFLMFALLARPLAAVTTGLASFLNGLSGGSAVLLGIILGLMMAFDMGGPLNKTAYAFAAAGLGAATATDTAPLTIMAAVMAAGMVPPLALALATVVRKRLFTAPERENGKAAWLLGAAFITEGAIPFAAADPLRVIPSIMLGSATTGAIVMATGVQLRAPHGGIFVFFAIDGVLAFVLAILAGMVVSAAAVIVAKSLGRSKRDLVAA
ncbi:PTS fructose transporter subunit IIABC [Pseudokineococcus lusitanus]|uniref:PTS system D-fructose-specific IIA component (F1P-forming) (Frc family) /PTS system D-fructose-specific IIB component (F1P-forming) (Frc family) /PTS system D-fructose-specific IIC component (F1P-f... n=1 Tax=Pseudokineococcus lusitanus TaxID=763993 RepID=A0A3N1G8J1_9ACTN|nr:fructose-specific PTS transporter subunit EIIC [Pseudokineococcus lusitanus]ROP26524.1 PTS system D-fructose-specific IIA component (F1P-forming) (Frc family) /PTS system D-fructose-specific IIB component (F1P-forming) (Frc family) /PTS system D-fructose-specific IIC component (F1P-forming) (Frc family) [Pseudokineococcus lusitanus]